MMLSSNLFASFSSAIFPSGENAWCALAKENIFGYTRVPKCSKGMRKDHSARFPPAMEGEADMSIALCSLKGCGRNRDTQSITFFSNPGTEPLYSGDDMMNASFANNRSRKVVAPFGKGSLFSTSWL